MSEMPNFPPAVKLTSGWIRFSKRTMYNLEIRIYFWKKSHDLVDLIIDQIHLSKCIPANSSHVNKFVNNA